MAILEMAVETEVSHGSRGDEDRLMVVMAAVRGEWRHTSTEAER